MLDEEKSTHREEAEKALEDDEGPDAFARQYLQMLDTRVLSMSKAELKKVGIPLFKNGFRKGKRASNGSMDGTDLSVFGANTKITDVVHPKGGVGITAERVHVGSQKYLAKNPHIMSRADYCEKVAPTNESLANIALRGSAMLSADNSIQNLADVGHLNESTF